ncbi:MAG: IS66 family transposase [Tenuifilaceae bacterium]|nr:IS66 family transposase [Tenuifilaceae bacterium]
MNDKELIRFLVNENAAFRKQIAKLTLTLEASQKETKDNQKETDRIVSKLTGEIKKLSKMLFSSTSEKRPKTKKSNIPEPLLEAVSSQQNHTDEQQQNEPVLIKEKKTKPPRRVYEGLEEKIINLPPLEDVSGLRFIRNEETIRYSFIEPKIIKIIYKRAIYGDGDNIYTTPLPDYIIERCSADISLLAHIAVNKFYYHLPTHRQLEMFKNIGIDWPKSTLNSWVTRAIEMLSPIFEVLEKQVINSPYLNIDETTIPILLKGVNKTKKGYMWGVISPSANLMSFKYNQGSRSFAILEEILKDYSGTIQSDGYSAYKSLEKGVFRKRIRRLSCLAHIRRKFIESEPTDPRAQKAIDYISRLYSIEKECYDPDLPTEQKMTVEQIKQYRLTHSVPILREFYRWLQSNSSDETVLPQSLFGKAVNYALNEYPGQIGVLRNGAFRIDNNVAERAMRAPVLGRKNYMFCGEHAGGERAAHIYSIMASCKMNKIDPYTYLVDILKRFMSHNHLKLDQLLPNKWTPLLENE